MTAQAMPGLKIAITPKQTPLTESDLKIVDRLTGWNVGIGIGALTIGLALGV